MSLVLTNAGEKLEIVATVVIPFTVHFADYVGATPVFTPGVAGGDTINGTKDLLAAPGSGQRVVRTISVHNDSGGADTITIQLDDGGTNYTIVTATVPDDYALYYDEDGWKVLDNNGALATTLFTHALLGPHHSDAATDTPTQGCMVTGNATPAYSKLVVGGAHQILKVNAGGTDPAWASFDWDDMAAGAAADMVHSHGSVAEGGVSLGPLTTVQMIDGGVIGAPADLRIEFDYTNGDLKLYLGDAAGADEVQILDSGAAVVLRIDSNGNVTVVEDTWVGIGAALERFVFNGSDGAIAVMGADLGINILAPTAMLHLDGAGLANGVKLTRDTLTMQWFGSADGPGYFGCESNDDLHVRTNATNRINVTADGKVGFNVVPAYTYDFFGDVAGNFLAQFFNDGNDVGRYVLHLQGGADNGAAVGTTYYIYASDGDGGATGNIKTVDGVFQLADTSDERRKDNIVDTKVVGLDIVRGLRVRDYTWKSNPKSPVMTSFVAQEAREVYPDMIGESPDGTLMTSRALLIPILTKAIQELDARLTKGGM